MKGNNLMEFTWQGFAQLSQLAEESNTASNCNCIDLRCGSCIFQYFRLYCIVSKICFLKERILFFSNKEQTPLR